MLYTYPHPLFKQQMDDLTVRYNTTDFATADPLQFPRRYHNKNDIEIVAFLIATIAWGRRQMILNSSERLLNMMGDSPFKFVMETNLDTINPVAPIHRTFFGRDLMYMCKGFRHIYAHCDSMEALFQCDSMWDGISRFRQAMYDANGCHSKHIPNPDKSACKRLHLALRWLVRNDGIADIGIWHNISPAKLIIPLDVHVGNTARLLNITQRKSNDRRTAEEITNTLRKLDPNDPIRYDFALFGAGIEHYQQ